MEVNAHRSTRETVAILTSLLTTALRSAPDYRLPVPTLLVHGQLDHIGDIATAMPAWAEREPLARYAVIPDAGHASNLDHPETFTALLTAFIDEVFIADVQPRVTPVPGPLTERLSCTSGLVRPTHWAPHSTAAAPTSRSSPRSPRRSSCACSTSRAPSPGSRCPSATGSYGTATCRGSVPVSATATGYTARYDPAAGLRCNPTKLLLDPYAKAIDGHNDWNEALFSYRFGDPDSYNDTDSAPYAMTSVVINPYFDWAGDRPLRIPYNETVIYEAHVKGMTMRHPDIPKDVQGSYAGIAHPAMIRHFQRAGGDGRRADAGAPVRARLHTRREGPVQLLGLQHHRLLRPAQRLRQLRHPRRTGPGVQDDGPGPAPGRHRGHPRRGLQPHRRRQPPRPDPVLPRHRQPGLLPAGARRPAALLRHHRHRQQPQRAPPRVAAADHGLAALLGHRDARRRLPVRPGLRAGPRVPRGRPALGVLRPGQPGPDRLPGQTDRRALGRRRGRLPGRRLPTPVDRVERQVPRHRARLLARRTGQPRRVRRPLHRLVRPLRGRQPPPHRLDQLRHRARRVHPQRPRLLQREAQRRQRRGQQRRRKPQPLLEPRRRRPLRGQRMSTNYGNARNATSSPPCCSPKAFP